MIRARTMLATLAAATALAGCTMMDGYGGVSVGYGGGYDPYYDGGYYDGGYYADPYYGWYENYYYPGTGVYVYDRGGHRHGWSDKHRRYWHARRAAIRDRRELRENWSEYRRERREEWREDRRERREDWRGDRREGSEGRRDRWRDRRDGDRDGREDRGERWRDRRGDGAAAPNARSERREARPPMTRQAPATVAAQPSSPARVSAPPPPSRPERPTVSRSVETPATSRRDD